MRLLPGRTSFRAQRPNQFDLSDHQPVIMEASTRKLMPTIIRLAQLVAVADPEKQYKLLLNSQEELEVQIKAFEYLVNERHFPLFGYEDDELMSEEIDQWGEGFLSQTYHPLLNSIPVRPMAIANHDIQPTDYGDLVALIYWLATINPSPPNLVCGQGPNLIWDRESKDEFRFMPILIYLEGMNLQPPLNYLPGLIRSVLHQTDTFFLDACPLCGGFSGPDFAWTVENFIWIRDDWQKAKPIYEGNQELIKWSNNTERLVKISQILKKAHSIYQFYKDESLPVWCR